MNQKCFSQSATSGGYVYGKTSYQGDRYRMTREILGNDVERDATV